MVSVGQGGVDPTIMGMGPVPAIKNALCKASMKLTDIEVLELNEAFAAQSLRCNESNYVKIMVLIQIIL
jgi:acetyl-CoA C-acetyltransferase